MSAAIGKGWVEKKAATLPEDQQWELSTWADEYFNAIQSEREPDVWRHVEILRMHHTDAYVAGSVAKPLAAQYIHFPPDMQDPLLDWLVADTICYAEVNATLIHFRKMATGKHAVPSSVRIAFAAGSLAAWAIWLGILVAAFAVSPWAGVAVLALTAIVQFFKIKASMARAKLLDQMLGTYQALTSSTLSWAVLWDHLSKSRDLGAVWPPELYRLVELRMHK